MKPSEPSVLQHPFLFRQGVLRFFIDFTQRLERHCQEYQVGNGAIKVNHSNELTKFDDSVYTANCTKQE